MIHFVNKEHELLDDAAHYALSNYGLREAKKDYKSLIKSKLVVFMQNGCLWGVKLTTKGRKRYVELEKQKGRNWDGQMR